MSRPTATVGGKPHDSSRRHPTCKSDKCSGEGFYLYLMNFLKFLIWSSKACMIMHTYAYFFPELSNTDKLRCLVIETNDQNAD